VKSHVEDDVKSHVEDACLALERLGCGQYAERHGLTAPVVADILATRDALEALERERDSRDPLRPQVGALVVLPGEHVPIVLRVLGLGYGHDEVVLEVVGEPRLWGVSRWRWLRARVREARRWRLVEIRDDEWTPAGTVTIEEVCS
jgi:hypothetical protein